MSKLMSDFKKFSKFVCTVSLCALALAQPAHAAESPLYGDLLDALEAGHDVTAVMDLSLCTDHGAGTPGPDVAGGFHVRSFIIPGGQYIAFANVHDTLSPDLQPVKEYLRYKVMPDGNVTATMTIIAEGAAAPLRESTYACSLDDGVNFVW